MDYLVKRYRELLGRISTRFSRDLINSINWEARGIGISGARGTGKSTLMLQHIAKFRKPDECIYLSLDDLYFQENSITEVIEEFIVMGGKYAYLDEVHKYPNWHREIKNLYDFHPELHLVISGSSIIALQESSVDLSRRIVWHELQELSLREYIAIKHNVVTPKISLPDLIASPSDVSNTLIGKIDSPIKLLREYHEEGAYPFFTEGKDDYYIKLNQIINLIIDYDVPEVQTFETSTLHKLKQLLVIISQSVPFKPNISKLADRLSVSRNHLIELLKILNQARLIISLYSSTKGVSQMNKPEKLYLHNSNLIKVLSQGNSQIGSERETFFASQILGARHSLNYVPHTDFLVDGQLFFEIGGKNKSAKQLENKSNSYLVLDDMEYGYSNRIPLWTVGFLY